MYREEITHYSASLGREMHVSVYGHGGMPLLAFPTQDSMCHNYEDFGMVDQIADFLNEGRVQLYVVDTVDSETWSNKWGDKPWRSARQEQYHHYIVDEVVPMIHWRNNAMPAVTGLSMGANHAAITFFRRPDLFRGVIALSGIYDTDLFFDGWMDSTLYNNAPEQFLRNMPTDHYYIPLYNSKKIILCCGQGAWEDDGVRTLRALQQTLNKKGIRAWCDFWGYDVNHDWPWWYKQMRYFLPFMCND